MSLCVPLLRYRLRSTPRITSSPSRIEANFITLHTPPRQQFHCLYEAALTFYQTIGFPIPASLHLSPNRRHRERKKKRPIAPFLLNRPRLRRPPDNMTFAISPRNS